MPPDTLKARRRPAGIDSDARSALGGTAYAGGGNAGVWHSPGLMVPSAQNFARKLTTNHCTPTAKAVRFCGYRHRNIVNGPEFSFISPRYGVGFNK